jgi:DNA-directed RNA polymerase subunit F
MKERNDNHINVPKNTNEENQNALEHFNKKRKLQNKVLQKIIENLDSGQRGISSNKNGPNSNI